MNPNNFNKRLENKGEKGANSKNENGIYFFKFPSLRAAVKKGTSLFQRCRHGPLSAATITDIPDCLSPMAVICTCNKYPTIKMDWLSMTFGLLKTSRRVSPIKFNPCSCNFSLLRVSMNNPVQMSNART